MENPTPEQALNITYDSYSYRLAVVEQLVFIEQAAPSYEPPQNYPLNEWPVLRGAYWDLYEVERVIILYRFLMDLDDTPPTDCMPAWWGALKDSDKLDAARRIADKLKLLAPSVPSSTPLPLCMESPLAQVTRLMEANQNRPPRLDVSWEIEQTSIPRPDKENWTWEQEQKYICRNCHKSAAVCSCSMLTRDVPAERDEVDS